LALFLLVLCVPDALPELRDKAGLRPEAVLRMHRHGKRKSRERILNKQSFVVNRLEIRRFQNRLPRKEDLQRSEFTDSPGVDLQTAHAG
jgi:hypothetical protein